MIWKHSFQVQFPHISLSTPICFSWFPNTLSLSLLAVLLPHLSSIHLQGKKAGYQAWVFFVLWMLTFLIDSLRFYWPKFLFLFGAASNLQKCCVIVAKTLQILTWIISSFLFYLLYQPFSLSFVYLSCTKHKGMLSVVLVKLMNVATPSCFNTSLYSHTNRMAFPCSGYNVCPCLFTEESP